MVVIVQIGKYKRKMGNILNYIGLSEYQVLIHTKINILIIWNEGERIKSEECMQCPFFTEKGGRRRGK